MGLPTTGYDWADVLGGVTDVLATPLVAAGTIFAMGLALAPRILRLIRKSATGR